MCISLVVKLTRSRDDHYRNHQLIAHHALIMEECIFCKIVKGEVPSSKIYEDDLVIAFMDIKPVNPGHALVVSKEHDRDSLV